MNHAHTRRVHTTIANMPPNQAPPTATALTMNSSNSSNNQAWFLGAPWTKILCLVFVLVQVLQQQQQHRHSDKLKVFQFDSTGDFVVGIFYLAMQLRRLERELGSRQMGEFLLLLVSVPSLLNQFIFPVLFGSPLDDDNATRTQFPILLLSTTMYWYTLYTPRLHPKFMGFAGIQLSEKALTQLWGLYLLGHSISIVNIILGIVISAAYFGYFYQYNIVPNAICNKIPWDALKSLFLLDPPPKIYAPLLAAGTAAAAAATTAAAARPRRATAVAPAPAPARVPPPQDAIDQLTAMGFEEDRVRQALGQSNNNVERAADRLLMG